MVTGGFDSLSQNLLAETISLLVEITGEDERWAESVQPDSRLEGDLELESIELAALGTLLTRAHGDCLRLSEFAASLDIDQIIGLTVGDLVSYLASRLRPSPAASMKSGSADDRD